MQRGRTAKGDHELQTNVPPEKPKDVKQPEEVPRRSARIAALNMNNREGKNKENVNLNTEELQIKPNPKVRRNNGCRNMLNPLENKENNPDHVEGDTCVVADKLPMESLSLTSTQKLTSVKVGCTDLPAMPTTPVNIFKSREGIRTPGSRANTCNKRNSSSPHPHNFLRKVEDPVVQRIDSPMRRQLLKTEETKSAVHFTQIVEREEMKFKLSCDKWNKILEEGNVPEAVHGHILSAIGQANLFQNKRFKQFKELIELHKDTTAEKKATESDLAGFWEMIFYQVEDVHKRFSQLDVMKSNKWEEEKIKPEEEKKIQLKAKPKETVIKKVTKPTVQSKFKLFRQQMLAKKEQQKEDLQKQNDILIY